MHAYVWNYDRNCIALEKYNLNLNQVIMCSQSSHTYIHIYAHTNICTCIHLHIQVQAPLQTHTNPISIQACIVELSLSIITIIRIYMDSMYTNIKCM